LERIDRMAFGKVLLAVVVLSCLGGIAVMEEDEPEFTADFRPEDCTFETVGENAYFILRPGYQLVLEGEVDGEMVRVEITVLDETQDIVLQEMGEVETRIVEEREYGDGEILEISRNFFAICNETSDVYYFGEEVDIYEDGEVVSHEGAWRAGEDGAKAGLMMPRTFLFGSRYFQEQVPGVAMDRAENVEMGLSVTTKAGTFSDCVKVEETTPLDPDELGYKVYCPGVGVIQDGEIELVEYGDVA
jgi:hypothetical protein